MPDVTQILNAIEAGDPHAVSQLLPLVYDELRRLAAAHMAREKPGQTLDATALVHEAYLRLVSGPGASALGRNGGIAELAAFPPRADAPGSPNFANRRHFFAAAAEAMRRILVEQARRKRRIKHAGGWQRTDHLTGLLGAAEPDDDLIALDAALSEFRQRYPVHARLVDLRFFAGLTGDEAAALLGISARTADRHWVFARAWLRRKIQCGEAPKNS